MDEENPIGSDILYAYDEGQVSGILFVRWKLESGALCNHQVP
jgi:hypothetical protein